MVSVSSLLSKRSARDKNCFLDPVTFAGGSAARKSHNHVIFPWLNGRSCAPDRVEFFIELQQFQHPCFGGDRRTPALQTARLATFNETITKLSRRLPAYSAARL